MMNSNSNNPTAMNGRVTALLNGKKEQYQFASVKSLEQAKKDAKEWNCPNYIGSGMVYFVDEVRNNEQKLTHYFRK